MSTISVHLTANTASLRGIIAELTDALAALPGELVGGIADSIVNRLDSLVTFDTQRLPTDATELLVVAKPTERFAILLAALRTGNVDPRAIEQILRHELSPLASSTVASVAAFPSAVPDAAGGSDAQGRAT